MCLLCCFWRRRPKGPTVLRVRRSTSTSIQWVYASSRCLREKGNHRKKYKSLHRHVEHIPILLPNVNAPRQINAYLSSSAIGSAAAALADISAQRLSAPLSRSRSRLASSHPPLRWSLDRRRLSSSWEACSRLCRVVRSSSCSGARACVFLVCVLFVCCRINGGVPCRHLRC